MPNKPIQSILKNVLKRISPSDAELNEIDAFLKKFLVDFEEQYKNLNLDLEVFVGGSFAKKTIVRRDNYDIDVFVRFDKKYKNEDISRYLEKILIRMRSNFEKIHGSRDYFRIKTEAGKHFYLEIIPVIKVKNPREAENITDLSYSHVNYIKKNVKNKELLDNIRLAKEFAYACHCYGAESYITGFSGYGLELLIFNYKSLLKFIKEIAKHKQEDKKDKDKIIIDIEKHYKNKKEIMMNINSSKLASPIVLVDPVFKQRNVLAALNEETFLRFKDCCKKFLKNPSEEAFELHKKDLNEIKKKADKNKYEFILIQALTNKQEGDIAGSKLLKFYNHLSSEINRLFDIKDKGFNYNEKQDARYYFVVKSKEGILIKGPEVKMKENFESFKKAHKNYFITKGKVYSKEKVNFSLKGFFKHWKNKNADKIKDMSIVELKEVEE